MGQGFCVGVGRLLLKSNCLDFFFSFLLCVYGTKKKSSLPLPPFLTPNLSSNPWLKICFKWTMSIYLYSSSWNGFRASVPAKLVAGEETKQELSSELCGLWD